MSHSSNKRSCNSVSEIRATAEKLQKLRYNSSVQTCDIREFNNHYFNTDTNSFNINNQYNMGNAIEVCELYYKILFVDTILNCIDLTLYSCILMCAVSNTTICSNE